MDDVRDYLNETREFKCMECNTDIRIKNIGNHMKSRISADMGGETGTEMEYSFVEDVIVKCPNCGREFKLDGHFWYAMDEGFKYNTFKLVPMDR